MCRVSSMISNIIMSTQQLSGKIETYVLDTTDPLENVAMFIVQLMQTMTLLLYSFMKMTVICPPIQAKRRRLEKPLQQQGLVFITRISTQTHGLTTLNITQT